VEGTVALKGCDVLELGSCLCQITVLLEFPSFVVFVQCACVRCLSLDLEGASLVVVSQEHGIVPERPRSRGENPDIRRRVSAEDRVDMRFDLEPTASCWWLARPHRERCRACWEEEKNANHFQQWRTGSGYHGSPSSW
jgi:hypothetical protein